MRGPTDLTDDTDFSSFICVWGHPVPRNFTDDVGTTSRESHGFDTFSHSAGGIFDHREILTSETIERRKISESVRGPSGTPRSGKARNLSERQA